MAFALSKFFEQFGVTKKGAPKQVVGIDFGTTSVKVVELERRDDMLALKTYGELQLGPYVEQPLGTAVEPPLQARTEALVDVMRESGVHASAGVLALPLTASFVTTISLAAKKDEDISSRVQVEARKYIPIPLTDVSLDWTELEALENTPDGMREVLIAAVQNDAYADMNRLLSAVKMASQPTEIELFSTIRAISKNDDTSTAILDLGGQTSKLYVVQGGMVRKLHRVFAGGAQVTSALDKKLGVSFEEAENLKRNYTPDGPEAAQIKQTFEEVYERPLQEFRRVLSQYETRLDAPIARIEVTGGSAAFADLPTMAGYILDRTVERTNVFDKVAYPAFMEDTLTVIAPTFTVALGAALRPFTDV